MAQRKSPPTKSSGAKGGSGKPVTMGKAGSGSAAPARKAPPRKPGKSIVNQKQTPWGLIATTVAIVLFAAVVIVVVIATHKSSSSTTAAGSNVKNCSKTVGTTNAQYPYLSENKCASEIKGLVFRQEPNRNHVSGVVKYDATPPVGGNHSPYWADCSGTVYPIAIANENAVHMLEHGAIWITYNTKTISAKDLTTLKNLVQGNDRMALSPYPNLKTPISLQAWGYQLFVKSASDPRVKQFINDLRYNPQTTPEYGATCSQPTFKEAPSTFGHPLEQPAST